MFTIIALSVISSVSRTLWSVIRIPIPRFERRPIIPFMSATAIGSIPANGSSRRRNFGSIARERAISVLLRSPPESVNAYCFLILPIENSSISSSSLSFFFSRLRSRLVSRTDQIFSSTVSFLNTEGSCGRYEIPSRALLYIGREVSRLSSRKISPAVGL